MLFVSSLFVFLLAVTIRADTNSNKSCETYFNSVEACNAVIGFSGDCQSSQVFLTGMNFSTCALTKFFWSYPRNNMTLVIETQYTKARKAYTIYLDNEQVSRPVSHIYRVFNNQETEVTTKDKTLIQYSDSNYQVILKFQAPQTLTYFGTSINYQTVPMV